ncbi:MAG: PIN domain-containing protein [Chloroflexi bacterium]|nr:MAG: PIN domain-containing protein [Chloroflexota bacterium]
MNLFVDTSGWISLFDRSDKYHVVASQTWGTLRKQPLNLVTSDYVFDETITHFLYRCGRQVALRFGRWVLSTDYLTLIFIEQGTWLSAWDMLQDYKDKEWAFTDCTSFVLMQQRSLWTAFTFDPHFEQAGFQRWPSISLDS